MTIDTDQAKAVHEAAWAMAEDEEAFWNDNWLLELPSSSC